MITLLDFDLVHKKKNKIVIMIMMTLLKESWYLGIQKVDMIHDARSPMLLSWESFDHILNKCEYIDVLGKRKKYIKMVNLY